MENLCYEHIWQLIMEKYKIVLDHLDAYAQQEEVQPSEVRKLKDLIPHAPISKKNCSPSYVLLSISPAAGHVLQD